MKKYAIVITNSQGLIEKVGESDVKTPLKGMFIPGRESDTRNKMSYMPMELYIETFERYIATGKVERMAKPKARNIVEEDDIDYAMGRTGDENSPTDKENLKPKVKKGKKLSSLNIYLRREIMGLIAIPKPGMTLEGLIDYFLTERRDEVMERMTGAVNPKTKLRQSLKVALKAEEATFDEESDTWQIP
ncbi:hypothetical protein EniLVp02_0076 [Vibrio phage EniLVp02]